MKEFALKVENVSKDFNLNRDSTTIKTQFISLFKKKDVIKTVQHALRNISLEIEKGEFFGIVGRNGSGKSTILKMLAGIYQPTRGAIQVEGKLVPFIELGVGFNPELTGRENVFLNGALLGFSKNEVSDFYKEVVAFAELEPFMNKKLKNYSSGMQVRLAFSMAIQAKADILLIDEVLAVGDADFQRKCFNYFSGLKKKKLTVVFVSHDMDAIRKYCDRAALINNGRVEIIGDTEKVAQEYIKLFNGPSTVSKTVQKNTSERAEDTEDTEGRWGDGVATIKDVSVSVNKKTILVTEHIYVNKDIEGLIAGIRVKNAAGVHVLGTNTKIEGEIIEPMEQGNKLKVIWSFPNILSDGEYTIDPAVVYDDGVTVADWWDDAVSFTVKKDRVFPYPIDTEFTVKLVH